MTEKTINERVINNLLLMYMVQEAGRIGHVEDDLKAQKLVFLVEKQFVQRKLRGFTYNFFRWHKGPYSGPLANDIRALVAAELLHRTPSGIELTKDGEELVKQCHQLLADNNAFKELINSIARKYACLSSDEIKETVYGMTIFVPKLRKVMAVKDVSEGQLILFNLPEKKARGLFKLDESWSATLELILDKVALDSLKSAQEDAVHGRVANINPL